MNHQIKQPIVNSRTFSSRSSSHFLDKSLSGSFEDPLNSFLQRKPSFQSKNTPINSQIAFKNTYTLFKIDTNLMPQFLERYKEANLFYRDEEFSQQADHFLTKIAMDRKIPDEFRASFPVYQILVSLSKIFMFNELEIVTFACLIDHCVWNLDDVLTVGEGSCLFEFPSNFGLEISNECKRFIIYLLIIAFSLKQYLGEKNEVDQIQAYCETICNNFQVFFNKWAKASTQIKFNYTLPEINSKFRELAKRDLQGLKSSVKDYNMMVDEIMGLTGTYATRTKDNKPMGGHPEPFIEQRKPFKSQKTQIFQDISYQPNIPEPRPFQGTSAPFFEEKGFSRYGTFDMLENNQPIRMPSLIPNFSRQTSFSNLLAQLPLTRKQPSLDLSEETIKKKVKGDENNGPGLQTQPSLFRDFSMGFSKPELQPSFSNIFKQEDFGNAGAINLPMLSKKASIVSQEPDDIPTLSRFQSNLSFLYEK